MRLLDRSDQGAHPIEAPPDEPLGAEVAQDLAIWLALVAALVAVAAVVGTLWAASLVLLPLPFLVWHAVQEHRRRRRSAREVGSAR